MNKLFKNKKIVFAWFVLYIIIIFLSVFANFIAYLRIQNGISLQNSHYARCIIIIFNLICIVTTTLIARGLAKRNHKPHCQNEAYSATTQKLQPNVVKGAFVTRLLTQKMSVSNIKQVFDAFGVSMPYANYMVVLFYIKTTDKTFFEQHNGDTEDEYHLARLSLTNVLDDLITGTKCAIQYCDIEGTLGCIVNIDNNDSANEFVELVNTLRNTLRKSFNIEFMVGFSNVYCGIDMLPKCYNQAKSCVRQCYFYCKDIVRYSDLEDASVFECYISDAVCEQLVAAMHKASYEPCESIINTIFDKNILNVGKSVHSAKFVLYQIATTLIYTIANTGDFENEQNAVSELMSMIENAGTGASASQIREHILSIIKSFCEHIAQKPVQKTNILAENAKRYVDQNYSNTDITVAKIAEHCNVSMAYLSTCFKKKYNTGLLEYINYVRIEHAKQILQDESCTVESVAEMVGFNNTRSYFRMFSRFVGTSPHKYRTMMLSGERE